MTIGDRGGFTLIEVMVVMVIVAIVAVVGGPRLMSVPLHGPDGAADAWSSARMNAVHGGQPVVFRPDSSSQETILFLPDGRTLGPGLNPRTGRTAHEPQ